MQKKVPYVAQLGNMDCSIACMTMLFRYYGLDVDIVDVGQVVHIGRDGVNLTQLKQATQQFGFKCTAYRYNKQKNILDSNLPAVVYSGSHLAVIGSKTVLGQYILLDPIKGKSIVNFEQIHDTFSDILIAIRPEKRIKRKKCKPKLKVAINYKLVAGIISLMLLIQALTLSIPLVEQALIDSITQSQGRRAGLQGLRWSDQTGTAVRQTAAGGSLRQNSGVQHHALAAHHCQHSEK